MRALLDLRFGRLSLIVLATVSALATVVILHGGNDRTPAQMAALAALREKPVAGHPATVVVQRPAPATHAPAGGGGVPAARAPVTPTPSVPQPSVPVTPAPVPIPAPAAAPATTPPPATSTPTQTATTPAPDPDASLPKVGHVFEVAVSAPSFAKAFGDGSQLPYLRTLAHQGTVLSGYRSLGGGELADELALVSGQAPNADTEKGCATYSEFTSGAAPAKDGLVPGNGCIYPDTALTVSDQVTATGKAWGAYAAEMGTQACAHPDTGAVDDTTIPFSQAGYDTRHNPFIYFHSLLDLGDCQSDDVDLSQLPKALHSASATPEFAWIASDACADAEPTMLADPATTTSTTSTTATTSTSPTSTGTTSTAATSTGTTPTIPSSTTTTTTTTATTTTTSVTSTTPTTPGAAPAGCSPSQTSGLSAENAFLKQWIPGVLHSAAFRKDGVLVIAITRSGDATGHPVRTGALVISHWTKRHATLADSSGPYALLRFTEDALRLEPLAHATDAPALAATLLGAK
jgi:hypothetical protein